MGTIKEFGYLIVGIILGFVFGGALIFTSTPMDVAAREVAKCEESLPRDKHCKWVITAEVVENG